MSDLDERHKHRKRRMLERKHALKQRVTFRRRVKPNDRGRRPDDFHAAEDAANWEADQGIERFI